MPAYSLRITVHCYNIQNPAAEPGFLLIGYKNRPHHHSFSHTYTAVLHLPIPVQRSSTLLHQKLTEFALVFLKTVDFIFAG
jgi:hypothetical protein